MQAFQHLELVFPDLSELHVDLPSLQKLEIKGVQRDFYLHRDGMCEWILRASTCIIRLLDSKRVQQMLESSGDITQIHIYTSRKNDLYLKPTVIYPVWEPIRNISSAAELQWDTRNAYQKTSFEDGITQIDISI